MSESPANGILNLASPYSFERTVERLVNLTSLEVLRRKGQIDAVLIEKSSIKGKDSPGDRGVLPERAWWDRWSLPGRAL